MLDGFNGPDRAGRRKMKIGIGHNGGPPLHEFDADGKLLLWRRAHRKAWKTPPREVALRRHARAEERGMTYREYTLEILERGRHL
jgi:hypothetical protein